MASSDYDMSDHHDALLKLRGSLRREPHLWNDEDLAAVVQACKALAGMAGAIRLERGLEER